MDALTTQNNELRTMLIKATEIKPVTHSNNNSCDDDTENSNQRDEIVRACKQQLSYNQSFILLLIGFLWVWNFNCQAPEK